MTILQTARGESVGLDNDTAYELLAACATTHGELFAESSHVLPSGETITYRVYLMNEDRETANVATVLLSGVPQIIVGGAAAAIVDSVCAFAADRGWPLPSFPQ